MAVLVIAVIALAFLLRQSLYPYFLGNPLVNGVILGILAAGIAYIFHQVLLLGPEARWLEQAKRNPEQAGQRKPRLLAPVARLMAESPGGKPALSAMALRTVMDGIGARLEESRETSRYLIGLLIFLGLLGTFYGLLGDGAIGQGRDRRAFGRAGRSGQRLRRSEIAAANALGRHEHGVQRLAVRPRRLAGAGLSRSPGGVGAKPLLQRGRGISRRPYPAGRADRRARRGRGGGAGLYPGAAGADRGQPRGLAAHPGARRGKPHFRQRQRPGPDREARRAHRPDAHRTEPDASSWPSSRSR